MRLEGFVLRLNPKGFEMITISIDPVIFSIGHLMIRWYGLIVATAIIVGVWLATREAERKGFKKEDIYDAAMWIVPGGLLGARLFHVLDHWSHEYTADPFRALYIWEGGLAIWGGVIGGLIVGMILTRRRRWHLPRLLDVVAPGLVLAQAIGRVACIITGDAVGKPTTGPFGLAYTSPGAMVPQLGVYYTPTQVYEIIMNLFIFAVLWRWRDKKLPDGALFLIYLLLYASLRFLITFWSSYEIIAFGLNQAQLISLVALIIGLPWLVYLLRGRHAVRIAT
ncbi:MAG: prolipoprotein diacylglyceryl transferase [Chloroflexota bacterium]|nr:MAG: prolipoprotein diacylglyceryl transferase [Chloroflexota bacterium]